MNTYVLIIILIIIIFYFKSRKSYTKKSIITNFCRKNYIKISNDEFLLKTKLNDKIYVKEFNKKYFPKLKFAKTIRIFSDPDHFLKFYKKLPDKYVVKYSIGTGKNIIVDTSIDVNLIIKRCHTILKYRKDSWHFRKMFKYFNDEINPRFLIEEYIGNNLNDYKFFVYKGIILYISIFGERYGSYKGVKKGSKVIEHKSGFLFYNNYDDNCNLNNNISFNTNKNYKYKYPAYKPPSKLQFETIKKMCKKFYEITHINFVRMDFYIIDNIIYFGEYTFYPNACIFNINKDYEKYLIDKYNFQINEINIKK